jgi:Conjugative transposon protein TcpC
VRRSSVASFDSGMESGAYGYGPSAVTDRGTPVAKSPWSGGGGRWMVWPMRVVLWAAILVIGYRGVMAIVLNETPASTNATNSAPAFSPTPFPVTLGEAYALQFGQVYLNFSPAEATQRAQQLAAFIPANISAVQPQFGWNGGGTLRLQSEQVAGIDVRSAHTAVVTLLATVNGHLMELGVPIYASGGGIVVSGEPALLPAPSAVSPPLNTQEASSDPVAQSALATQLPAFFQAYASGDQATLNRYLAPGASLNGLDGAVVFNSIASIAVPRGGATRDITVTVNWMLPGQVRAGPAQLAETYDMSVVDQQSGRWYVKEIRASTQPMGNQ